MFIAFDVEHAQCLTGYHVFMVSGLDLARAPRRAPLTARKKGSGYENEYSPAGSRAIGDKISGCQPTSNALIGCLKTARINSKWRPTCSKFELHFFMVLARF